MQKTRKSFLFCTILHHFPLKPQLEDTVGEIDAVFFFFFQLFVNECLLDSVDIRLAALSIGVGDILSGEAWVDSFAD